MSDFKNPSDYLVESKKRLAENPKRVFPDGVVETIILPKEGSRGEPVFKDTSSQIPEGEMIRPDLMIARYSHMIFLSPRKTKVLGTTRSYDLSKDNIKRTLIVSPATYVDINEEECVRTPTEITCTYLYIFIKLWDRKGRPSDGCFYTNGLEIFRELNQRPGKTSYEILRREMHVMRSCNVYVRGAVISKDGKRRSSSDEPVALLNNFRYYTRFDVETKNIKDSKIWVSLDAVMLKNMQEGISKPVVYNQYMKLRDKYDSCALYKKLDVILGRKEDIFKRESVKLLDDLEIDGVRYKLSSKRLDKLKEFKKDLDGAKLSRGILKINYYKGKNDWVLKATMTPVIAKRIPQKPVNDPETAQLLFEEMKRWTGISSQPEKGYSDPIGLVYATTYPEHVIRRAISIYRSDYLHDDSVRSSAKVFTKLLHEEVHRHGLEWIGKTCKGLHCKYNPNKK